MFNSYIGRRFGFPVQLGDRNQISMVGDDLAIRQSIYVIVSTVPGETLTLPSQTVLPVSLRPKRIRTPTSAAEATAKKPSESSRGSGVKRGMAAWGWRAACRQKRKRARKNDVSGAPIRNPST